MTTQTHHPKENPMHPESGNVPNNLETGTPTQAPTQVSATLAVNALKEFLTGISKTKVPKALELLALAIAETADSAEWATMYKFNAAALESLIKNTITKTLAGLPTAQRQVQCPIISGPVSTQSFASIAARPPRQQLPPRPKEFEVKINIPKAAKASL